MKTYKPQTQCRRCGERFDWYGGSYCASCVWVMRERRATMAWWLTAMFWLGVFGLLIAWFAKMKSTGP